MRFEEKGLRRKVWGEMFEEKVLGRRFEKKGFLLTGIQKR